MIEKIDIFTHNPYKYNMRKFVLISFAVIVFAVVFLVSHQVIAQQHDVSLSVEVQAEALKGGYRLIDMNELWQLYKKNNKNLLLVDTRQDWEYNAGHIKNALNFPMEPTWLARLTQRGALEQFLGPDKVKTIVFY